MLLLVACQPSVPDPTRTPSPTKTPGPPSFKVNKSTGLYEAPNIDAKYTEELSEGTLLIPASDK